MTADAGLASTSDWLLFAAVLAYALAMLGYAAELAFGRERRALPRIAGGSTDVAPTARALDHPGLDWSAAAPRWPRRAGQLAVGLTTIGWALHAGSLVTRGLAVRRVPWGNMYEFSSAVALAAVTAYLWLLTRHPVRRLGAVVMLPVVASLGIAGTILYAPAAPLVPALNSYWIKIHVVAAMIASGVFMVGFAVTVAYLACDAWERRRAVPAQSPTRLPSATALDALSFRLNAFGFTVWTFSTIAGAIWAEAAWGRYWGWDPKETWAFITWVVYAGYLHARATAGWKGRRAAGIGIAGFVALMITYFAVNLWVSGLHSYAGV